MRWSLIPKEMTLERLTTILLETSGVFNQKNQPWTIWRTIFSLLTVITILILSGVEVLLIDGSFGDHYLALTVFLVPFQILSNFLQMNGNQDKLKRILNCLEEMCLELKAVEEHRNVFEKVDKFVKKMTYGFGGVLAQFVVLGTISKLAGYFFTNGRETELIFKMWIPWGVQGTRNYLSGLFLVSSIMIPLCIVYLTFYVATFTIILHLAAIVKMLRIKLETNGIKDPSIIRHHAVILRLLREFNEIFCGQFYLIIIISCFQPCGYGYMIIKMLKNNDIRVLDFMFRICVALGTPLIICGCGQELSTQLELMHHSAYMGDWDEDKPEVRRQLLMLMMATSRPPCVNYKGFVKFNFVCYSTVIQGVYSYLMMISKVDSTI